MPLQGAQQFVVSKLQCAEFGVPPSVWSTLMRNLSTKQSLALPDVSPMIAAVCEGSLPGWRHGPCRTTGLCKVREAPGLGVVPRAGPSPLVAASSFPPSFLESALGASQVTAQQCQESNHHGTEPQEAGSQSEHIKKETVVEVEWCGTINRVVSGVRYRGQVE